MTIEDIKKYTDAKEIFVSKCCELESDIKKYTKSKIIQEKLQLSTATMTKRYKNPETWTVKEVEIITAYLEKIKP